MLLLQLPLKQKYIPWAHRWTKLPQKSWPSELALGVVSEVTTGARISSCPYISIAYKKYFAFMKKKQFKF